MNNQGKVYFPSELVVQVSDFSASVQIEVTSRGQGPTFSRSLAHFSSEIEIFMLHIYAYALVIFPNAFIDFLWLSNFYK